MRGELLQTDRTIFKLRIAVRRFGQAALCCALMLTAIATNIRADDQKAIDPAKLEFFEAKIRPVLIKHCYECHSAKSKDVKGSLLVDSAAGLLLGGDSGPAIIAGKPDESPLIEALRYDGVEMPPDGRLPANVIKDFERWVEMGSPDPRTDSPPPGVIKPQRTIDLEAGRQFWAFRPIVDHRRPDVSDKSWPKSDIDVFVLQKLEEAGLKPASDADPRTLIRRVYFDLIGLPPSPEEVAEFLENHQNDSDDALKKVVDRLLESPQFGVHWGRHWLDVARYADSNGADFNATFHNAWKYRDYVIDSFNRDKPFDQFVREQIAGDLLAHENDEQLAEGIVATGFLMLGTKMLSERDKEKLTMDVVDEQLNTIGQAFMAVTLGCARCHDHKFDPIPTKDYYALAGILKSTRTLQGESQQYVSTWPRRRLPAEEEHVAAVNKFELAKKELRASIQDAKNQTTTLGKKVELLRKNTNSLLVDDSEARLTGSWTKSTYSKPFIGEGYIHDAKSEKGEKWAEFTVRIPRTAKYDVQLAYSGTSGRADNVPISIKHAEAEVEVSLDQEKKGPIDGLFASLGHFPFDADKPATITVSTRGTIGYVIIDAVRLVEVDDKGNPVANEVSEENDELNKAESELESAKKQLEQFEDDLKQLDKNSPPPLPEAIAVAEAKEIGDCEINIRGEHRNLGPKAPRGFLQVAYSGPTLKIDEQNSGRLELADWIASPEHPLTSRVFVNRIWHHLIGQGIVASVDNFGRLGDQPTHPELLDRLAADFMRDGWSTRKMVRQIVLSRTYQLSSQYNEASWNADPENLLLWRAHRRGVPAESIRDSILSISGQLDLSPDGSPVEGLGTLVTQNVADEKQIERKETLHRSVYLPIIRSQLPPMLVVFDFADPDLVVGRRPVTNVPAQALLLLNSPFVMEQAEIAADRVRSSVAKKNDGDSTDARTIIEQTYELVLSRRPTSIEIDRAEEFLEAATRSDDAATDNVKGDPKVMSALGQLIHTLFASAEFRMLE
tara:strand:+ start:218885 stop:221911 length:3027 start_codon:yes stop_codon:yes gene_type:complete